MKFSKKRLLKIFLCFLCISSTGLAQTKTAETVLDKAIAYHDPNGNWPEFNGGFQVTMTTPNNTKRVSTISINIPQEKFQLKSQANTLPFTYTIDKDNCTIDAGDGISPPSKEQLEDNNINCERAALFKNYYTYLYGLPMKLKDPGTNLSSKVENVTFKGKKYLKLKVTYDKAVGSDVWFFYFNPTSYAMEVYQFFKGDPNGAGKDTGEYILLTEESTVNQIKMPKVRAWYYNKDDKYLGTDSITE